MSALPKSLPIMPRLQKAKRGIVALSGDRETAEFEEEIFSGITLLAAEEDITDAFDSSRGAQRNGRISFMFKPLRGSQSGAMTTKDDPFTEPLE